MEVWCEGSDGGSGLGGEKQASGGEKQASGGENSTIRTFDGGEVVRRGHRKCLLIEEVKTAKNTNKDKTARHKKVRAMDLVRNTKWVLLYFIVIKYTWVPLYKRHSV